MLRLVELGPRMKLELVKIEEGILSGEVLYHSYIKKTQQEIEQLKKNASQKAYLKMSRRKEQEENVKRKNEERDSRDNRRTKRMRSAQEAQEKDKGKGKKEDDVDLVIDDDDAKLFKDDDDFDDDEIERYED